MTRPAVSRDALVLVRIVVMCGVAILGAWFCSHPAARAQDGSPADRLECYWRRRSGNCICSGNWRQQNPALVELHVTHEGLCR